MLTASGDSTARIWDAESGQELVTLSGHTGDVYSAVYSPDGALVLTASGDNTARIWDAEQRRGVGHPQRPHRRCDIGGLQPGRSAQC